MQEELCLEPEWVECPSYAGHVVKLDSFTADTCQCAADYSPTARGVRLSVC
jgi:hypothetical protein